MITEESKLLSKLLISIPAAVEKPLATAMQEKKTAKQQAGFQNNQSATQVQQLQHTHTLPYCKTRLQLIACDTNKRYNKATRQRPHGLSGYCSNRPLHSSCQAYLADDTVSLEWVVQQEFASLATASHSHHQHEYADKLL